jgi:hypothetical protein
MYSAAVTERLTIGFAAANGGPQGVAIAGAGALLAVGGDVTSIPDAELSKDAAGAWTASADGAFAVALEPLGPPVDLGADAQAWVCTARGQVGATSFDGLGHLTREAPGGDAVLERAVIGWLGAELAVVLAARRSRPAAGHGDEDAHAAILRGAPLEPLTVADPRLSSAYDADGNLVRCGLELWETADSEFPQRFGGRATAHGELRLADGRRTRVAFIAWRGERVQGAGRYDITER